MSGKGRTKKSGKSPYQRYGKAPYVYKFKTCSHRTTVAQSTPTWSGKACAICNIITSTWSGAS